MVLLKARKHISGRLRLELHLPPCCWNRSVLQSSTHAEKLCRAWEPSFACKVERIKKIVRDSDVRR